MQIAIDYLTIVALGGLALTIVAAEPIVELLYGADYVSGAIVLTILVAAFVPICIGNVAGNMVVAMDLQRRYIWFAALGPGAQRAAQPGPDPRVRDRGGGLDHPGDRGRRRLAQPGRWCCAGSRCGSRCARSPSPLLAAAVAGLAVWGLREAGAGA